MTGSFLPKKKSFARKHKTLPVGHCKHTAHSSLSSSKEASADWHKKWLGPDDKIWYFNHTGYYIK